MTSSAVLGAAAGTGLALLVAMTVMVYRYYSVRRWGKEWNYKGSWTAGPATYYYRTNKQQAYVTTQKVGVSFLQFVNLFVVCRPFSLLFSIKGT